MKMNDDNRHWEEGWPTDNDLDFGDSFGDILGEDLESSFKDDLENDLDSLFSGDLGQSSFLKDIHTGINPDTNQAAQVQEDRNQEGTQDDSFSGLKEEVPLSTRNEILPSVFEQPLEISPENPAEKLRWLEESASEREEETRVQSFNQESNVVTDSNAEQENRKKIPSEDRITRDKFWKLTAAADSDRMNGSKYKKTILSGKLFPILAAMMVAGGLIFYAFSFIGSGTQSGTDYETDSNYMDLTVYGSRYRDFFSKSYIASYKDEWGSHYPEICVIDPGWFTGPADDPDIPKERAYDSHSGTDYSCYYIADYYTETFASSGFTVMYAQPNHDREDMVLRYITPPRIAEKKPFFNEVKKYFKYNFGSKAGDILETKINGNTVCYMAVDFEDVIGYKYTDVFSFEEKPQGYAFITEYRFKREAFSDPEEALFRLYGSLEFYTGDFETIEAGGQVFDQTSIYNPQNGCRVRLDFSDMNICNSDSGGVNQVEFYAGDISSDYLYVEAEYNDFPLYNYNYRSPGYFYSLIPELACLDDNNTDYAKVETDYKEFRFEDLITYYYAYDVTNIVQNGDPDIKIFWFAIEDGQEGEFILVLKYIGTFPDAFDPESFLEKHITIE